MVSPFSVQQQGVPKFNSTGVKNLCSREQVKLNKSKHVIPSKEKDPTKTYVVQDSDCEGAAEGLSNIFIPEMNNTSFIPKVVSVSRWEIILSNIND